MNPDSPDIGLVQPAPRLVEIQWFWRRLWVFVTTIGNLVLLAGIVWALAHGAASMLLVWVALALIAFQALIGAVYILGATSYELVQLLTAAKIDIAAIKVGS